MQQILVDLRCLNYPKITGVNAYTIRLLHCLFLIQSKTPDLHFSFYALQSERVQFLCSKFPFLADLFSSGTMLDLWYCEVGFSVPPNPLTGGDLPNNSPKVESNNSEVIQTSQKLLLNSERSANSKKSQLFNFHNPKFYEVRTLLHAYFFGLNSDRVPAFDLVILPQPRTLLTNSNSRVLTVFHDIFYLKEKSRSWRSKMIYNVNLTHKIFNQSARIFANSFSTATDLTDFFGVSNKVKLVYPALPKLDELHGGLTYNSDLEFAKKSLCPSDISLYQGRTGEDLSPNFVRQNKTHSKYILAISGIEPRKNWLNLIHAINYLKTTKGLKIPLVLAGTIVDRKYFQKLQDLVQGFGLQNLVTFVLDPIEAEKQKLIQACEFILYISLYEGFGFPILEAFEYSKPLLTAKVSSMPEIAQNGAVFVNPFDIVDIASGLQILWQDIIFRQSLVNNIPKITSQFSWDELQKAVENEIAVDLK